jgi:hypothetical protein
VDEGAAICCDGSPEAIAEAFEAVVADVGYARATETADLDLTVVVGERAVAFSGELPKSFAVALARRLALRLRARARVLTVRLVADGESKSGKIECEIDDVIVLPDGSTKQGRWAEDTIAHYGSDFTDACDGKAYFAVSALLEEARDTVVPDGRVQLPPMFLRAPASLGSVRLDDLAKQVRLADKAVLANIGGRSCVRITNAGATVTSFLEPHEVASMKSALGRLLG